MGDAHPCHSALRGGVKMSRWQPCFNWKVLNFNGMSTEGKCIIFLLSLGSPRNW